MGKLASYILMLVVIDLLFIITGQILAVSPGSIILSAVIDPGGIKNFNFWEILITSVGSLAVVGGVVAGLVTRSSDILVFVTMGTSLALLIGDFISIYVYLSSINLIFATLLMTPITLLFTFTIIEWIRGKD